jgi:hypothetical protein
VRSLAQRNVTPTEIYPGMYGPGQTHRDGPVSPREQTAWTFVIGGLLVGGILLMVLAAAFDWG